MHDRDSLHRFLFEHLPFRGHLVHMDASWQALIEHRQYPQGVRTALGETAVAALLLAATIKFEGVLSLQLQGDGPVHLLLAQCTSSLGVRALARYRDESVSEAARAELEGQTTMGDLIGSGNLTVTVETNEGAQRYQGIVPITGQSLAQSLQTYFQNSEQLATRLWLHADEHGAAGMLLQRLPGEGGSVAAADPQALDEAWSRVQIVGETLTAAELRTLSDAEILHRLFNEDDVRLYEPSPVFFKCRCSRERVSGMLLGLGEAESQSILAEHGTVEVRCDFCNRAYVFDAVDVAQLFSSGVTGAGSGGDTGGSVH